MNNPEKTVYTYSHIGNKTFFSTSIYGNITIKPDDIVKIIDCSGKHIPIKFKIYAKVKKIGKEKMVKNDIDRMVEVRKVRFFIVQGRLI